MQKQKPKTTDIYEIQPSKQVRTLKVGDQIELRRRWRFPGMWALVGASIVWNAAMVFAVTQMVRDNPGALGCLSLHIIAGVVMGYYSLALLFNETRLYIEGNHLRVITSPIPVHKLREFHAHDVSRVEIADSGGKIGENVLYDLLIYTGKGAKQKVLGNLNHRDDALFLKQELEFILGLDGEA